MRRDELPDESGLIFILFRAIHRWTQGELAEAVGTAPSVISEYESGARRPSRRAMVRAAKAAGVAVEKVDPILEAIRDLREFMGAHRHSHPADPYEEAAEKLSRGLESLAHAAVKSIRPGPAVTGAPPRVEDREQARGLWERLERYEAETRRLLVEEGEEYRNWAFCELLCDKSLEESADRALDLAEMAVFIAERIPGENAWRSRVQGYAWAHVGDARRRRGDPRGAQEAFSRFRQLWRTTGEVNRALLDEMRIIRWESQKV
ncbi:MAG: helix-turn-helix transcriptional regulator [Thermoanaerobaculia bacterium]